jgi:hypothetical protein
MADSRKISEIKQSKQDEEFEALLRQAAEQQRLKRAEVLRKISAA